MRPPTIILDIDGLILRHHGSLSLQMKKRPQLLPGVLQRFEEWDRRGAVIVLTTGRRESCRQKLERILYDLGIFYDAIVFGCTGGVRYLVNDRKADGGETAKAINVNHNEGLLNVSID